MANGKGKLIIYTVLVAVLLLGLINILLSFSGRKFSWELVGFFVLLFISLLGFIGYANKWGERMFFFTFLLYMANLLVIWYYVGDLYVFLLLVALVGFLISFPRGGGKEEDFVVDQAYSSEPHSEVFDVPEEKTEVETKVTEKKKLAKRAAVKHSPGKFVASKLSNNYHLPKCDWAKKIKKSRQVWFKTKEEAWEKGYKAHSCVEE